MRIELAAFWLSLFARAALAGLTRAANPDDRCRITLPETRRRLTRRKALQCGVDHSVTQILAVGASHLSPSVMHMR